MQGAVAGSLGGEMEALENDWRREDELVDIGVEMGCPAKGILGGGGEACLGRLPTRSALRLPSRSWPALSFYEESGP